MRPSLVVDVIVRVVFHSAMVLAVYLLFAGHNMPGGGFVGGLVAGAAVALRYVGGGIEAVHDGVRLRPWTYLGLGILLVTATVLVPVALGGQALEHGKVTLHLGPLGDPKVTSALPFDLGVFLVVLGLVLMVFEAFGESATAKEEAA